MRLMHAGGARSCRTILAVSSHRALLLWVLLTPCVAQPQARAELPSDAELERSGAVIGNIVIDNLNIFDLNDPKITPAYFVWQTGCTHARESR